MSEKNKQTSITNRKAFHEYEILERMEAGIALKGTEVKSIRQGRTSFKDSYVRNEQGELWVINLHISPYDYGTYANHDPLRPRKLLMHRYEIKRLIGKIEEKGLTLIPLKIYFKKGICKMEVGLARGKKFYDKRKDIAKRDMDRDAQRELKNKYRVKM